MIACEGQMRFFKHNSLKLLCSDVFSSGICISRQLLLTSASYLLLSILPPPCIPPSLYLPVILSPLCRRSQILPTPSLLSSILFQSAVSVSSSTCVSFFNSKLILSFNPHPSLNTLLPDALPHRLIQQRLSRVVGRGSRGRNRLVLALKQSDVQISLTALESFRSEIVRHRR